MFMEGSLSDSSAGAAGHAGGHKKTQSAKETCRVTEASKKTLLLWGQDEHSTSVPFLVKPILE